MTHMRRTSIPLYMYTMGVAVLWAPQMVVKNHEKFLNHITDIYGTNISRSIKFDLTWAGTVTGQILKGFLSTRQLVLSKYH